MCVFVLGLDYFHATSSSSLFVDFLYQGSHLRLSFETFEAHSEAQPQIFVGKLPLAWQRLPDQVLLCLAAPVDASFMGSTGRTCF